MTDKKETYSWGRYPLASCEVLHADWQDELKRLLDAPHTKTVLPYGLGRSYGDSCVNDGGRLLSIRRMNRIISFSQSSGLLRAEAGMSLAEILEFAVPRGWFLPVSPGTKFVTLGGAIANDIHGKNHHREGTFGCHVRSLSLMTSSGQVTCSLGGDNETLFRATVGGLGLTGLIVEAEVQLKPIETPFIDEVQIQFANLDEFFALSAESAKNFEYTVAWLDCVSGGENFGRGIFMQGNHARLDQLPPSLSRSKKDGGTSSRAIVPFDFPSWALNKTSISLFNSAYFHKQRSRVQKRFIPYGPFFHPLDSVLQWNRMYGNRGFFQFQCVVPTGASRSAVKDLLRRVVASGKASFLAVLKEFSEVSSPGLLSFPRPGTTLCLDFANQGAETVSLLKDLETLVREAGGALYPAKDALMSAETFSRSYPRAGEFSRWIDPKFSSSFWRRVHP